MRKKQRRNEEKPGSKLPNFEIDARRCGQKGVKMDNNYNQQTNANPGQQGNFYQQTNPYMDNGYGSYGSAYHSDSDPDSQEAPNIFRQFVLSFIPPQYGRLTKVRTGSMILFVTLLALVATIISFAGMAFSYSSGDVKEWLNALPDFEVSDGRLYMAEDFVFDEDGMFIYLTDKINGFSYDDASEIARQGYRNVLLAGRDRLSLLQNGEYQQLNFRNLGSDVTLNKNWIADTVMPVMMILIAIGYIVFFVGRIFWYFLCAAVYLLFALLMAQMMKKKQSAGALFRTAVYSKVLMFVVTTLLGVIPFVHFSVPFILRIVITMVFMGFAIAKLPERN